MISIYLIDDECPCTVLRLNARLSLSTATPSIGGSAPTLETLKLTIIPNLNPQLRGGTGK